jgi:hypothetical protein
MEPSREQRCDRRGKREQHEDERQARVTTRVVERRRVRRIDERPT